MMINKTLGTNGSNRPTVASFFSGAGGMDIGFAAAGFNIAACMDLELWACDTLRANLQQTKIIGPPKFSGDIKNISPQEFQNLTGFVPQQIDVFTGGPPCQPFSQAATQRFLKGDDRFKRKGFDNFEKGTLLFDYIEYIKFFLPKVFLLENVPGLLTMDNGVQLKEALTELRALGYRHTKPEVLKAVDYGVPQHRNRLIVWGVLSTEVSPKLPMPTHGGGLFLRDYNTVAQALYNLDNTALNHEPREHKESSVARYRGLDFGMREQKGRVDRLHPLKPSKTVIAGGMHGGGRSHLHPYIARTMTVRECARLQTFPDNYRFLGSMSRQFTQVGNAVPPLLAEHFAREIGTVVFGLKYEEDFKCEQYLLTNKSTTELDSELLKKSIIDKPDWVYKTHVEIDNL